MVIMGELITSEIHEDNFLSSLKTNLFSDSVFESQDENHKVESTFDFQIPENKKYEIKIEHYEKSTVDLVGLQIWRGAFYLSDYLIHNRNWLRGKSVLELAAGTGLTSIVAGIFSRELIATDINRGDILNLITKNIRINSTAFEKYSESTVKELDFFNPKVDEYTKVDVILAADVVYDASITEAFFKTLRSLIQTNVRPSLTVLIAIEKRSHAIENDSGSVVSYPNYNIFERQLKKLANDYADSFELDEIKNFPQYFSCYESVRELVLWKFQRKLL